MTKLEELLEMWRKDAQIDRTQPNVELINIPQLHSKYLTIMSKHRLQSKEAEFKFNKYKKIKWEYYTGKMDDDELKKYGWEPFPFVLKSDITTYFDSDEDLNKLSASKIMHDEIVDVCQSIMKELNSRTFQLRDYIAWERFIQGIG
jgi:hypothetical protein